MRLTCLFVLFSFAWLYYDSVSFNVFWCLEKQISFMSLKDQGV